MLFISSKQIKNQVLTVFLAGISEKTRPFVAQIPGIMSYQLFRNDSKYVPENVSSIGVEIHFKDKHALDVFMNHPKHFEANAVFEKYLANPAFMVLTHEI